MRSLQATRQDMHTRRRPSVPTVPALVLRLTSLPLHHGAVGIIRSLGRMGVPVYGIVEDRFTPAAVSRYLTGSCVWQTHGLDAQQLLQGMARIGERLQQRAVVIPIDDVGAIFVAEHADGLRKWFLSPQQIPTLPRTLADKRELYRLCKRIGVACPATFFPQSIDDVLAFIKDATVPIVVKAAESWLLPIGAKTTSIAWTADQAASICASAYSRPGANVVLQEYIGPGDGEDWFYHGYYNKQSEGGASFTGRKIRSYPVFAGPTTLGKAVINEPLRQQAEALLEAISYCGIVDLDYRFDKRDGVYKLLDFNPRIGAQFRLFEDRAGVDVVRAMYCDLTGRPAARSRPIDGRTFIVEFHDLAASVGYLRKRRMTLHEWRQSLDGEREWAWFSRDDVWPFVMMCIRLLLRMSERVLRVRRARQRSHHMPTFERGVFPRAAPEASKAVSAPH